MQNMVEPFFDDGFTIRTSDANHRNVKMHPMSGRKFLQYLHHIWGKIKRRFGQGGQLRNFFYHKMPDPLSIEILDIQMTISSICSNRKKECAFREKQLSAVDKQM